jgi:hypothetical protein
VGVALKRASSDIYLVLLDTLLAKKALQIRNVMFVEPSNLSKLGNELIKRAKPLKKMY